MSRPCKGRMSPWSRQDVASSPGQNVTTGEAECRCTPFAQHKTACFLTLTPLAYHEAASGEPVKRRSLCESGRRDSNPRQLAWEARTLPLSYSRWRQLHYLLQLTWMIIANEKAKVKRFVL